MSAKKYRVRLSPEEQMALKALASKGRTAAYRQTHARILLACDEAQEDGSATGEEIASVLKVGVSTVTRVRRRCVEEGLEAALDRKKQVRRRQRLLDGEAEAHLVALACGKPPQGQTKWTIKLLAQRLVECEIVETVGLETVRRALKKRSQALVEGLLVYPAEGECGLRVRHGGCAGSLPTRLRGRRGAGVHGLDEPTAGQGESRVASRAAGGAGHLRLRIRAVRREQPVHAVRAPGGMAARRGDGATDEGRLGGVNQESGGRGLPG